MKPPWKSEVKKEKAPHQEHLQLMNTRAAKAPLLKAELQTLRCSKAASASERSATRGTEKTKEERDGRKQHLGTPKKTTRRPKKSSAEKKRPAAVPEFRGQNRPLSIRGKRKGAAFEREIPGQKNEKFSRRTPPQTLSYTPVGRKTAHVENTKKVPSTRWLRGADF